MSIIKKATIALLVLISALGVSVGGAESASAATAVRFCFKYANPPAFSLYASKPVYLYYRPAGSTANTWYQVKDASGTPRAGYSDATGCGTFYNTPSNVQLVVRAYTSTVYQTWDGWSQYYAATGTGTVNVGSGLAYRTA